MWRYKFAKVTASVPLDTEHGEKIVSMAASMGLSRHGGVVRFLSVNCRQQQPKRAEDAVGFFQCLVGLSWWELFGAGGEFPLLTGGL